MDWRGGRVVARRSVRSGEWFRDCTLKINALITTLATMQIVRGLAYIISDGKAVGIEDERFFTLGYANWLGLPAPIWLTVGCFIILACC